MQPIMYHIINSISKVQLYLIKKRRIKMIFVKNKKNLFIKNYSTKIPESNHILNNIDDFEKNQNIKPLISILGNYIKKKQNQIH